MPSKYYSPLHLLVKVFKIYYAKVNLVFSIRCYKGVCCGLTKNMDLESEVLEIVKESGLQPVDTQLVANKLKISWGSAYRLLLSMSLDGKLTALKNKQQIRIFSWLHAQSEAENLVSKQKIRLLESPTFFFLLWARSSVTQSHCKQAS